MTRVMIIGNAGGGKSALSRVIARVHQLPVYELDQIQWNPGWVAAPAEELCHKHAGIISEDRWLIDGYGPWPLVIDRIAASDTIVFVDLPLRIHIWWATKRQIKSLVMGHSDGPKDCPMWPVTFRLYRMIWNLHQYARPKLYRALQNRPQQTRLIHIGSVRALNALARDPF
ncbi:MAG: flagellar protein FlaR [Pseudomonadota bacterium]